MSDEPQKELRDARLQRALEHAPDAHMRPDAAVRQAVLKAAHAAVAPGGARAPAGAWWARKGGPGRMPWNAAFATVLLAGFVTLLWQGQDVPDARLDTAASGAPAAMSPAAPAPVQVPAAPVQKREQARDRQNEREREVREERADRRAAAREEAANQATLDAGKAAANEAAVAPAPAPVTDPVPAPSPAPMAKAAPAAAASPAPSAAMADAAPARIAPVATLPAWTALRVVDGLRAVPTPRADAGSLPALLQALAATGTAPRAAVGRAASASEAPAPTPPLRLQLMQGADMLGVLEIAGPQWRFTPTGGAPAQAGRVDAPTADALQAELRRLGLLR